MPSVVALLDGTVLPADQPLLRADDLGVIRGDGVFDALLAIDGVQRDVDEHLARLRVSASMLGIDIPPEDHWRRGIEAALDAHGTQGEVMVRLIATRGPEGSGTPTCYVLAAELSAASIAQRAGIAVCTLGREATGRQLAALPHLLPGAKSLSYAVNMALGREARRRQADDAILLDPDGFVLEGPTSSLVVADGMRLSTPPTDGILDGITVRRLFDAATAVGWTAVIEPVHRHRLDTADGAWLVSSGRLIAPIISVDQRRRGQHPQHEVLAALLLAN